MSFVMASELTRSRAPADANSLPPPLTDSFFVIFCLRERVPSCADPVDVLWRTILYQSNEDFLV